jgi:hypothetical protein
MKRVLTLFLKPAWWLTLPLRRRAVGTLREQLLDVLAPMMETIRRLEKEAARTTAHLALLQQGLEAERTTSQMLLRSLLREVTRLQLQLEAVPDQTLQ